MSQAELPNQINQAIGAHGAWKLRLRTAINTGACDIAPEFGPSVKPSEEKPRRNGIPAWQSGEVKADVGIRASEISTTTAHDYSAERTGR